MPHQGLFQFIGMPFESSSAPEMFPKSIDVVLTKVEWQLALFYLHNITIFFKHAGRTNRPCSTSFDVSIFILRYVEHKIMLILEVFHSSYQSCYSSWALRVSGRTIAALFRFECLAKVTEHWWFPGLQNVLLRSMAIFIRISTPCMRILVTVNGRSLTAQPATEPPLRRRWR